MALQLIQTSKGKTGTVYITDTLSETEIPEMLAAEGDTSTVEKVVYLNVHVISLHDLLEELQKVYA